MDNRPAKTYVPAVMECVLPRVCTKGRPREFDVDEALAAALRVFWSKGYEAASLTDLTEAMGITRPSLYAAFGNKEALFRKALDLYEQEKLAYIGEALKAPTSREVAERLLRGALAMQTSDCEPKGCMRVLTSVSCSPEADSIRADLMARRQSSQRALCDRMQRARDEGDLPEGTDVDGLCAYLGAVLGGMSIQASGGAPRAQLESLVETALGMWPGK
ncbi:MAG: TetR/AcrR family transcriptional regulator [Sphingomonas sp.]|nr:TetR/AcrR family transcriptional regulator [Sphingomonas sp.]